MRSNVNREVIKMASANEVLRKAQTDKTLFAELVANPESALQSRSIAVDADDMAVIKASMLRIREAAAREFATATVLTGHGSAADGAIGW